MCPPAGRGRPRGSAAPPSRPASCGAPAAIDQLGRALIRPSVTLPSARSARSRRRRGRTRRRPCPRRTRRAGCPPVRRVRARTPCRAELRQHRREIVHQEREVRAAGFVLLAGLGTGAPTGGGTATARPSRRRGSRSSTHSIRVSGSATSRSRCSHSTTPRPATSRPSCSRQNASERSTSLTVTPKWSTPVMDATQRLAARTRRPRRHDGLGREAVRAGDVLVRAERAELVAHADGRTGTPSPSARQHLGDGREQPADHRVILGGDEDAGPSAPASSTAAPSNGLIVETFSSAAEMPRSASAATASCARRTMIPLATIPTSVPSRSSCAGADLERVARPVDVEGLPAEELAQVDGSVVVDGGDAWPPPSRRCRTGRAPSCSAARACARGRRCPDASARRSSRCPAERRRSSRWRGSARTGSR